MAGNRFKFVEWTYIRHLSDDSPISRAADDIISTPDKHLLTQAEVNQAEGGAAGLAVQAGTVVLGLSALFAVRPRYLTYLKNAQLRPLEWLAISGTAFASYHIGYELGARFTGDAQKLRNHWMAYYFVKQNNRFEGRQILTKPPKFY
eukprot:403371784